jgi:hypothetical protein
MRALSYQRPNWNQTQHLELCEGSRARRGRGAMFSASFHPLPQIAFPPLQKSVHISRKVCPPYPILQLLPVGKCHPCAAGITDQQFPAIHHAAE